MDRREIEWCLQGVRREMASCIAELKRLADLFDTTERSVGQRRTVTSMGTTLTRLAEEVDRADIYWKTLNELPTEKKPKG